MNQTIGTEANLSNGPRNMEPVRTSGGTIQSVGETANLKPTPVPLQEFSKGTRGGTLQQTGEKASLQERSAFKGWQSANTPMSERAIKQSK